METILRRVTCDFCKRKEDLSMKQIDSGFLQWREYKALDAKYHFCSNECERKFLEIKLNMNLRLMA